MESVKSRLHAAATNLGGKFCYSNLSGVSCGADSRIKLEMVPLDQLEVGKVQKRVLNSE